jgi:hypothetical protein
MKPKHAWKLIKTFLENNEERMNENEKEAFKIVFIDDIRLGIIENMQYEEE